MATFSDPVVELLSPDVTVAADSPAGSLSEILAVLRLGSVELRLPPFPVWKIIAIVSI